MLRLDSIMASHSRHVDNHFGEDLRRPLRQVLEADSSSARRSSHPALSEANMPVRQQCSILRVFTKSDALVGLVRLQGAVATLSLIA
jgi:hypothetical protein